MREIETRTLPVLPLTTGVVIPPGVVTLTIETPEAEAALRAASEGAGRVLLVPRIGGRYAAVGTVARVEESGNLPNGAPAVILQALHRATCGAGVPGAEGALWVEARDVDEPEPTEAALARGRELRAVLSVLAERRGSRRLPELLRTTTDPGALADGFGSWSDLPAERKVELLEAVDVEERISLALELARESLAQQEVADRIRHEVGEGMERRQREFLLRQQLEAVRKELAEMGAADGDAQGSLDDYRARLDAAGAPEPVRQAVEREIGRLESTPEQSPEHGWIRTWLDTVLDVPWAVHDQERLDVEAARAILDSDHTGLDDVKDRIVEHLAVRKLRSERGLDGPGVGAPPDGADADPAASDGRPPGVPTPSRRGTGLILTLVGPPGVGKTSLGESIARATGRRFTRVALGGVRDEAEVRGHRRTYVGAMPGRIVRALREAGSMNPVILLDEVDKVGSDWRGDPSSALLEVLDPAQNHTFRDHYLDVDLDLSGVLFLATANVVEGIPGPLLDRMEVVRLDGYTEDEKVAIARDHLFARQRGANGLGDGEVLVGDDVLRDVVTGYTREAGVRNLERELGRLLRKVAARVASGAASPPVTVGRDDLRELLGRPRFEDEEVRDRTAVPGVAAGLAVTGAGGDVLFVEAGVMDGEPGLTLTGQLGDVMKESAEIALSYVRAHAAELGIDPSDVVGRRFHVHVPAGAVPKDGPSAGVTIATALVSLLTGRPVRGDVGMTGELTLQGRVLPIGGVKQKVLAAERAGLSTVVLPRRNGPDLDDVPDAVRDRSTFRLAARIGDVLEVALEPAGTAPGDLAAA